MASRRRADHLTSTKRLSNRIVQLRVSKEGPIMAGGCGIEGTDHGRRFIESRQRRARATAGSSRAARFVAALSPEQVYWASGRRTHASTTAHWGLLKQADSRAPILCASLRA